MFGEIVNNQVELSDIGHIVQDLWENIPKHFENAVLDRYVIMPNHFHGILILKHSFVGTRPAQQDGG